MKLLGIFELLLTTYLASAISLQGRINDTCKQQLFTPVMQNKEAVHRSRITHGSVAGPNQFPYQVALKVFYIINHSTCGGSILSNLWVLTAAHCIIDCTSVSVLFGSLVLDDPKQEFASIPRSWTITHKDFNRTTLHHDIGLIQIPPITYRLNMQPVELPPPKIPLRVGLYAYQAGWGYTSDEKKTLSPTLLYHSFKLIRNAKCAEVYGTNKIYRGKFCVATFKKIGPCGGDSGGALVLEGSHIQIGIGSFVASSGCESGYPAGYTRVDFYLDWIRNHTGLPGNTIHTTHKLRLK